MLFQNILLIHESQGRLGDSKIVFSPFVLLEEATGISSFGIIYDGLSAVSLIESYFALFATLLADGVSLKAVINVVLKVNNRLIFKGADIFDAQSVAL